MGKASRKNLMRCNGKLMTNCLKHGKKVRLVFQLSMLLWGKWTQQGTCTIVAEWLLLHSSLRTCSSIGDWENSTLPISSQITLLCRTQEAGSGQWVTVLIHSHISESSIHGLSKRIMMRIAYTLRSGYHNSKLFRMETFTNGIKITKSI